MAQQHELIAEELAYGTCLQGYLDVGYERLMAEFGDPVLGSPDNKTDAQWNLRFADGTVATVYNYKDGPSYRGANGTPVEQVRNWHVGGFDSKALDLVREVLA